MLCDLELHLCKLTLHSNTAEDHGKESSARYVEYNGQALKVSTKLKRSVQLDYIQNMGFTAIWITPVTEQLNQSTADGEAYHGYWQQDMHV